MSTNSREAILAAARRTAQARGYGGLNFRDLAAEVGIKAASIYHHFPSKAELGAAVAKRYWQDTAAALDTLRAEAGGAAQALRLYPATFRTALENGNRICLCSFMAAEIDDLPVPVKREVQHFADVNVTWLRKLLAETGAIGEAANETRAQAMFAAIAGAQLVAHSRSNIALYDRLIDGYRTAGLLPA